MTAALADAPAADVSALKPMSTKREVADFLGCSVDYVNALMRTGELGHYKRGRARQANVSIGRDHVVALLRSWER
jgi:excisionase family DNA binding protein